MKKIVMLAVMAMSVGACATVDKMSWAQQSPDEFMVMSRAPLSLPPEYDLRPVVEPVEAEQENLSQADEAFVSEIEESK